MIFRKLREGLRKTREKLTSGLSKLFGVNRDLDDAFLMELEEVLYGADLGGTGLRILNELREEFKARELKTTDDVRQRLRSKLSDCLGEEFPDLTKRTDGPMVVMFVGVNGTGKTTSIAKFTQHLKDQGHQVVLGACDTYRAAAVEQLSIWAERLSVEIAKKEEGSDPASVAFDAADLALEKNADFLLVDTAGRLHTREDLMAELGKIRRVLDKRIPGAPHESFLVLDATTGQNAIRQAEQFKEYVPLSGVMLAKLDGTARGGAVISIRDQLDLPVRYVGLGEQAGDLERFDPQRFLNAILQEDAEE